MVYLIKLLVISEKYLEIFLRVLILLEIINSLNLCVLGLL